MLQQAERDVHDDEAVGGIDAHVHRLPHRRRQERQPVVVAGRREDEQDQQRRDAEHLEREADEFAVVGPRRQLDRDVADRALRRVPFQHERRMQGRDQEHRHADVAAIVQQRQEPRIEPGERADRQDDRQHRERAGAERLDPEIDPVEWSLRRMPGRPDRNVCTDEQRHAGEQGRVVDDLPAVPRYRLEAGAHAAPECDGLAVEPVRASDGGRLASAARNSAPTRTASSSQTARCARR